MSEWHTRPIRSNRNRRIVTPGRNETRAIDLQPINLFDDNPVNLDDDNDDDDSFSLDDDDDSFNLDDDGDDDDSVSLDDDKSFNLEDSDESDDEDMATPKVRDIAALIKAKEGAKALVPLRDHNKLDILHFKMQLINALEECEGMEEHEHGHVHILADEREYARRLGLESPIPVPGEPKIPTEGKLKRKEAKIARTLHREYEHQVRDLLRTKFPTAVIALTDRHQSIPKSIKSKEILQHIENKQRRTRDNNGIYLKLLKDIQTAVYKPSNNGAEEYFKEIDDILSLTIDLKFQPIHYDMVMAQAQQTFEQSKHKASDIDDIATEWEKTRNMGLDEATDIGTIWVLFKKHYNEKLGNLYIQRAARPQASAYYTHEEESDEDEDWKSAYTHQLDHMSRMDAKMDHLAASVHSLLDDRNKPTETVTVPTAAMTQGSPSPSALSNETLNATLQSLITEVTTLKAAASQRTNQNKGNNNGSRRSNRLARSGPQTWRRFDKWCWTCGVNLHHNSDGSCRRASTDYHKKQATFQDPQGGNISRNHLWQKWCSPSNHVCDTKEE